MKGFLFPSSHSASSTALEDWDRAWCAGWEHDINTALIVGNLMWKVDWNIDSLFVPGCIEIGNYWQTLMWLWARLSSPPLLCVCVSNWHLLLMSTCWRLQDSLSCYKPIRKFPEKMFVRNISWKSWLSLSYQKYERDLLTRDINFLVKYFKLFWPLKCFTIPIKVRSGCYCRINYFCLPDIDTFIFVPNITLSTSVFERLISFKYHEWHF